MGAVVPITAGAGATNPEVAFPVCAHILDPDGSTSAEVALTDAEHHNLRILLALAGTGDVVAHDRATGRIVFDSRQPRLAWPDRPDPIAG